MKVTEYAQRPQQTAIDTKNKRHAVVHDTDYKSQV